MLKLRIISALIGAPIFLASIWLGVIPFGVVVTVLVIAGLIEYYIPWPNKNIFPAPLLGVPFGASLPVLVMAGYKEYLVPVMAVFVASVLVWQIFAPRSARAGVDAGVTVLGAMYAGLLPSYLICTRALDGGREFILAAVIAVWACDIAAYFAGKAFGRHKLAPEISPHKTIEGAAAGVAAALLTGLAFAYAGWFSFAAGVGLGLITGCLAQVGDLIASMLKREVGIKDYGNSIPGHGGILDRFDGLFFTAPFVYFLFALIK